METVVRYFLFLLVYLGVGTDVALAIICQYNTANTIHRKYCSERCCDYDDGGKVCCRYSDKEGIYLGTIVSAVVIMLAIIICMCRICFRRTVRERSCANYGSSGQHFQAVHEDVSQSPRLQNRVHPTNLTLDGEPVPLEIQMPPAYVTHPPPYTKYDPAKCAFKNEFTPSTEPPPVYSAVDQSQTGT